MIDAALEVHRILGPGYGEWVYENALCAELRLRAVPYERQVATAIEYKGECVGEGRLDLVVAGHLVVELKAVATLAPVHTAQVLAYLRFPTSGFDVQESLEREEPGDQSKRELRGRPLPPALFASLRLCDPLLERSRFGPRTDSQVTRGTATR